MPWLAAETHHLKPTAIADTAFHLLLLNVQSQSDTWQQLLDGTIKQSLASSMHREIRSGQMDHQYSTAWTRRSLLRQYLQAVSPSGHHLQGIP